MSIKLSYIYFITFILTFFPMFVIYIKKGTNGNIYVSLIFLIILYLFFIFNKIDRFKQSIKQLLRIPITKYYLFFLAYIVMSLFIHILLGHYTAPVSFYAVRIYKFFVATIPVYLLPLLGLFLGIRFKCILKLFIIIIWSLFLISIIQYLCFLFDIKIMISIFDFFTNARAAAYYDVHDALENLRVYAFFSEPSALGQFIFIVMPFVISIHNTKYALFNNKYLNLFIKRTILVFMLCALIFTKSPIYLVLCFIELFVLFFMIYWNKIKKYLSQICLLLFILITILFLLFINYQTKLEQTYVYRIIKTIYSFGDFDKLILLEPSLATRIVSYSIQISAFIKAFIFGCGLNNVDIYINHLSYIVNSHFNLTFENMYNYLLTQYCFTVARSILYTSLAEFGLIGFSLYVLFIIKNLKFLSKIRKSFQGIEASCLVALIHSFVAIGIISFYNLGLDNSIVWLIYGWALAYLYIYIHRKDLYDKRN